MPLLTVCGLTSTVRDILGPALELIYPDFCGGCGARGDVICQSCEDVFEKIDADSCCPLCGRWIGKRIVCGSCMGSRMYYSEGSFGFSFRGPLREAIHVFKFQGRKNVGRYLMRLLRGHIQAMADRFDVIVPLPVTEKRLRERGFNQSFIIAEEIGGMTGKPLNYNVLFKTKETRDQYLLSRQERRSNVRGAFAVKNNKEMAKMTVLLVDDLFTTGSTAREASKLLLRAGAHKVVLFTLARTPS